MLITPYTTLTLFYQLHNNNIIFITRVESLPTNISKYKHSLEGFFESPSDTPQILPSFIKQDFLCSALDAQVTDSSVLKKKSIPVLERKET